VPTEALTDTAEFYLRLHGFSKDQILERKLTETQDQKLVSMDLTSFAGDVASEKPVPGGGSVSAYAGSLAASLLCMVCRLTLKRPEYEKHWPKVKEILQKSETLRMKLLSLVDEDSQSFSSLMQAYRLPKQTDEEKRGRSAEIQKGLRGAAEVPLTTMEQAADALVLAVSLGEYANENVLSDLQTAVHLAYASAHGASSNVAINMTSIKDEDYKKRTKTKLDGLNKQVEDEKSKALAVVSSRSKGT